MKYAGIDIGSRTIELVVIDEANAIILSQKADTGYDPRVEAMKMIEAAGCERVMATGYGRSLIEIAIDAPTVTEIKAHARGVHALFPEIKTVLDIGGQDSKAILLDGNGKVRKFEMNDRCAAGSGKFLEIMARTLGFDIEQFGNEALKSESELSISSMCTVFAESEVTSMIGRGMSRNDIALALHKSVVNRAAGMINRVSPEGEIVFTGGVANNEAVRSLLKLKLGREILFPEDPQMVGALGAALLAAEQTDRVAV